MRLMQRVRGVLCEYIAEHGEETRSVIAHLRGQNSDEDAEIRGSGVRRCGLWNWQFCRERIRNCGEGKVSRLHVTRMCAKTRWRSNGFAGIAGEAAV